jgi:hypothetical protein
MFVEKPSCLSMCYARVHLPMVIFFLEELTLIPIFGTLIYTERGGGVRGVNQYKIVFTYLYCTNISLLFNHTQSIINIYIYIHNAQRFNVETQMGENQRKFLFKYVHMQQPTKDTNLLQYLQAPT